MLRHAHENGHPGTTYRSKHGFSWIPAFAGMTQGSETPSCPCKWVSRQGWSVKARFLLDSRIRGNDV